MLWEDATWIKSNLLYAPNDRFGELRRPRGQVDVVLLRASSGAAAARTLLAPAVDYPRGDVAVAFARGGVGAIDYAPASGVVAACSPPRSGLPPPGLLVWDWDSAALLQAVLLHPLDPTASVVRFVSHLAFIRGFYTWWLAYFKSKIPT